jgi:hypothetical protein
VAGLGLQHNHSSCGFKLVAEAQAHNGSKGRQRVLWAGCIRRRCRSTWSMTSAAASWLVSGSSSCPGIMLIANDA